AQASAGSERGDDESGSTVRGRGSRSGAGGGTTAGGQGAGGQRLGTRQAATGAQAAGGSERGGGSPGGGVTAVLPAGACPVRRGPTARAGGLPARPAAEADVPHVAPQVCRDVHDVTGAELGVRDGVRDRLAQHQGAGVVRQIDSEDVAVVEVD